MKIDKKFVLILIGIFLISLFTIIYWDVVYLFVICGMVAYLLHPIMKFIEKKTKVKRGLSISLTLLFCLFAITIVVLLFVPVLKEQIESLMSLIPEYTKKALEYLNKIDEFLSSFGIDGGIIKNIQDFIANNNESIVNFLTPIAGGLVTKLANIPGIIFNFFFGIMITVYFLYDGEKMIEGFINLFDTENRVVISNIFKRSHLMVFKYLKMKTILSGGLAIVLWIGFLIFGIENAFLYAIIAFLFDFVPYIGGIVAAILPCFVAFLDKGLINFLLVIAFIVICQQIQGSIVAPKFQADSVGIHPITGILSLLVLSKSLGAIGMFISVPVAGFIQIILKEFREYYKKLN